MRGDDDHGDDEGEDGGEAGPLLDVSSTLENEDATDASASDSEVSLASPSRKLTSSKIFLFLAESTCIALQCSHCATTRPFSQATGLTCRVVRPPHGLQVNETCLVRRAPSGCIDILATLFGPSSSSLPVALLGSVQQRRSRAETAPASETLPCDRLKPDFPNRVRHNPGREQVLLASALLTSIEDCNYQVTSGRVFQREAVYSQ